MKDRFFDFKEIFLGDFKEILSQRGPLHFLAFVSAFVFVFMSGALVYVCLYAGMCLSVCVCLHAHVYSYHPLAYLVV